MSAEIQKNVLLFAFLLNNRLFETLSRQKCLACPGQPRQTPRSWQAPSSITAATQSKANNFLTVIIGRHWM